MGISPPPGLSDEKAQRILAGFRKGRTLREFWVSPRSRFFDYCDSHPEYAAEALPAMKASAEAALRRKGDRNRGKTHCVNGHSLADAFVFVRENGRRHRNCRQCWMNQQKRVKVMPPEEKSAVVEALKGGASINQVCWGVPVGGGPKKSSLVLTNSKRFYGTRQVDPEFDRFVTAEIADSLSTGQRVRHARRITRARTAAVRDQANDYYLIRAMLPANYPDKDAVISFIIEDLLTGAIDREDVRARVKMYVAEQGKFVSTINYPKFGRHRLHSLDAQLFEDGNSTLGDTATHTLWD
jgi:hypothetical protein